MSTLRQLGKPTSQLVDVGDGRNLLNDIDSAEAVSTLAHGASQCSHCFVQMPRLLLD
jgi:hypothetical protein